ncbi:hypothetical protein QBC45DRAFT_10047 [Copromyces sp. CBS 386.78]|nr:hypothetical protein QBC45DRAFT_10047 [Copromyces sp. CBS 386.78]
MGQHGAVMYGSVPAGTRYPLCKLGPARDPRLGFNSVTWTFSISMSSTLNHRTTCSPFFFSCSFTCSRVHHSRHAQSSFHLLWCQSVPIRRQESSAEPVLCPTDQAPIAPAVMILATRFTLGNRIFLGLYTRRSRQASPSSRFSPTQTSPIAMAIRNEKGCQVRPITKQHSTCSSTPRLWFHHQPPSSTAPSKVPGCPAQREAPEFPDCICWRLALGTRPGCLTACGG